MFCQDAKLKAEEDSAKAAAELKKLRFLGASNWGMTRRGPAVVHGLLMYVWCSLFGPVVDRFEQLQVCWELDIV